MKYNIVGFDQETLCKYGLDAKDAHILRWFVDFLANRKMVPFVAPNGTYYWVNYKAIINDLPLLHITNKRSIANRFQKMVKAGILGFFLKKNEEGTFSMYKLNELKFKTLLPRIKSDKIFTTGSKIEGLPLEPNTHTKDSSIKTIPLKNDDEDSINSPSAHLDQLANQDQKPKKQKYDNQEDIVATGGSFSPEYRAAVEQIVKSYNEAALAYKYSPARIDNIQTFYSKAMINLEMVPLVVKHIEKWFEWTGAKNDPTELGDRSVSMLAFHFQHFYDYLKSLPTDEEQLSHRKFLLQSLIVTIDEDVIRILKKSNPDFIWSEETKMYLEGEYEIDLERECMRLGNGVELTRENFDQHIFYTKIDLPRIEANKPRILTIEEDELFAKKMAESNDD